jgi:hypothetical protein
VIAVGQSAFVIAVGQSAFVGHSLWLHFGFEVKLFGQILLVV